MRRALMVLCGVFASLLALGLIVIGVEKLFPTEAKWIDDLIKVYAALEGGSRLGAPQFADLFICILILALLATSSALAGVTQLLHDAIWYFAKLVLNKNFQRVRVPPAETKPIWLLAVPITFILSITTIGQYA